MLLQLELPQDKLLELAEEAHARGCYVALQPNHCLRQSDCQKT